LILLKRIYYIVVMVITQSVTIPANHRLTIDVPPDIPAGPTVVAFAPTRGKTTLGSEYSRIYFRASELCEMDNNYNAPLSLLDDPNAVLMYDCATREFKEAKWFDAFQDLESEPEKLKDRGYGCAKGQIWMADDFDAPLEDLKDYM